jgi:hypothetical protein
MMEGNLDFQEAIRGCEILIVEAVKKLVFTKIGTSNINNLRYENRPFLGLFHSFVGEDFALRECTYQSRISPYDQKVKITI